jgi:hypothetical protein
VFGSKSVLSLAGLLATCFGDFIFTKLGALPLLNIFGPKGTGKTEQAKSILSCFGEKQNEVNMTKVTPYAAAHNLKMFINAFVLFDEYKNSLNYEWIELMKSIFNRQPRIRGTIKEGADTIAIPVNSMVFMCGQEMPTADPALLSRCIFNSVYNPHHTAEEKKRYNEFKELDNTGKSHFIDEIISYRNYVESNYMDTFYAIEKDLSEKQETEIDDRVIRNYATILAVYKLLYDKLNLSISYEKLVKVSVQCMAEQMNILSTTNELGTFWSIFQSLIDRNYILYRKNYLIEDGIVEIEIERIEEGKRIERMVKYHGGKKLLFLRWHGIYQLIAEAARRGGSELLPEKSLLYYMTHHKAFEGYKDAKKFDNNTNQAMVFDYDELVEWTQIEITEAPTGYVSDGKEDTTEKIKIPGPVQGDLPF